MDVLIDQVVGILGAVLATALVAIAVKVLQKLGIAIDADNKAKLEYFAKQGASLAEERAAAYLKTHGAKLESAIKQRIAVDWVLAKLPRVDPDEAKAVVESVLPHLRAGAAAGVQSLGNALQTPEARP